MSYGFRPNGPVKKGRFTSDQFAFLSVFSAIGAIGVSIGLGVATNSLAIGLGTLGLLSFGIAGLAGWHFLTDKEKEVE